MQKKHFLKGLAVTALSILFTVVFAGNTYAEKVLETGLFTDENDVRWEYNRSVDTETEAEAIAIKFFDKPAATTEIIIPSLNEVLQKVPNASSSLDTYFLDDASAELQSMRFTETKRESTASINKIDMSNTSKIQILGIEPMIAPDIETELIFGENMVIGDKKSIVGSITLCTDYEQFGMVNYRCNETTQYDIADFVVPDWYLNFSVSGYNVVNSLSEYLGVELEAMTWKTTDQSWWFTTHCPDELACNPGEPDGSIAYYVPNNINLKVRDKYGSNPSAGVFAGYKLKLSNIDDISGFNYVGWRAFKDSTLSNTTVTINGDGYKGTDIFSGSNVQKAILNIDDAGEGLFRDCVNLTEIEFGDNVTSIGSSNFMNTNLGSLDFSSTNIKNIRESAFENANISELNLNGVANLWYRAFKNNHLVDLYLPKSIEFMGATVFENNQLNKVTVAYDTLTYGTILPLYFVIDGVSIGIGSSSGGQNIEELNIIAPYGTDDELSPTHIQYEAYKWGYACWNNFSYIDGHISYPTVSGYGTPCPADGNSRSYAYNGGYGGYGGYNTPYGEILEGNFVDIENMKNIIAPNYFAHLHHLKRITISDGYEFIGDYAFLDTGYIVDGTGIYGDSMWRQIENEGQTMMIYGSRQTTKIMEKIDLPESLKGVGNLAFNAVSGLNFEMTLPIGLEYIGVAAFRNFVNFEFDFYFPELKFLGDNAFTATQVHNITLSDKLQYVGFAPFQDCLFINDVTIDYDLFNPQKNEYYNRQGVYGDGNFFSFFGTAFLGSITEEGSAELGYKIDKLPYEGTRYHQDDNGNWRHVNYYGEPVLRFGTITFTNKVQAEYPNWKWASSASDNKAYFAFMAADKLDLSQSGWKTIPPYFFTSSKFGEILLPHGLENIYNDAFNSTVIHEELVLPDSIINVGRNAFNQEWTLEFNRRSGLDYETVKITHLPTSLQRVEDEAFFNALGLEIETFDLPNLEYVGTSAFARTKIKNLILRDMLIHVGHGAFSPIKALENITIDCNLHSISSGQQFYQIFSKVEFMGDYQAPGEYSGQWNNAAINTFDIITFTEKAVTEPSFGGMAILSDFNINKLDLSATPWKTITSAYALTRDKINELYLPNSLETIPVGFFYETEIANPITLPETIKTIDAYAFQQAKLKISNNLPDGLQLINVAAFYAAQCFDDLIIPANIAEIRPDAFNAGEADVHYDSVTILPKELVYAKTNGKDIFEMFWNVEMDKLIIESDVLPVTYTLDVDESGNYISDSGRFVCFDESNSYTAHGCVDTDDNPAPEKQMPEFHGLKVKEVILNNLKAITANAFEDCPDLEVVDLSNNSDLQFIGRNAFLNANELSKIIFGDGLVGKDIAIGEYAFKNTGIETIGNNDDAGINLAAANFNTQITHRDTDTGEVIANTDYYAFAEMPNLKSAYIPSAFAIQTDVIDEEKNLNGSTIPSYTFANDPELEQVVLDYQLSNVGDGAFLNDDKLAKLFVWGNTNIEETEVFNLGTNGDENNLTIPQGTNIFAYSDAPAESYANAESRDEYIGEFYALDEVLAITSNRNVVILNEDKTDFDKTGLKLYAQRRDGVILESDWKDYNTAFARINRPEEAKDISFEEGRGRLGSNEADIASVIYDAPKPFNTISLANQNYANVDFEFMQMPSSNNPLVAIHYPDGYTNAIRTTTLATMTKDQEQTPEEPEPEDLEVPNTGVFHTISGVAVASFSVSAFVILGAILIVKKAKE